MDIEGAFPVDSSVSPFLNTIPFFRKGPSLKQTWKVKQTFKRRITCWQKRSTQLVSLQDICSQSRSRGWSMATYWEAYTFLSDCTFSQFQAFTALYNVGIITCKCQFMEKYNEGAEKQINSSQFKAWAIVASLPEKQYQSSYCSQDKKKEEISRVIPNLRSPQINCRSVAPLFPSSLMVSQ